MAIEWVEDKAEDILVSGNVVVNAAYTSLYCISVKFV